MRTPKHWRSQGYEALISINATCSTFFQSGVVSLVTSIATIVTWVCLLPLLADGAPVVSRPVPAKDSSTKTLLLYSATHSAYSLLDSLELLKLQLGRVATTLEPVPVWRFETQQLDAVDYIVVLCPEPHALINSNVIAALAKQNVPILWVGFGLEAGKQIAPFAGQFAIGSPALTQSASSVRYRDKEFNVGSFYYIETRLPANAQTETILVAPSETNSIAAPVCWKAGQLTFFGAEPQLGALGLIFEDILLDFFSVKDLPSPSFIVRITGYVPESNHREFKRMADFLHSRSVPFAVSIAGFPIQGTNGDLGSNFLSSLLYAQQRGGRIVLQGGGEVRIEYWDRSSDRPLAGWNAENARQQITSATETALKAGLLPIAWQTPQYAASSDVYSEVAKVFRTAFERVQISDATHRQIYAPGGLTMDRYQRLIVPENLGFVALGTNSLKEIQTHADLLTNLRATVMGCSIDAFQPLAKLMDLITLLESYHLPFVDLADLGNRVELPDAVLLTGDATAKVNVQDATLRWKTFNRAGNLLAEDEQRTKVSGQRELKRIGIGIFELVQWTSGEQK